MVGAEIRSNNLALVVLGVVLVVLPNPFEAEVKTKKFVGILYIMEDGTGNITVEGKILKDPLKSQSVMGIVRSAKGAHSVEQK
jgi:hypothetical protein